MTQIFREAGIGSSKSPGTTKQIDSNRTEIIKLLITCCSESLYIPSNGIINMTWFYVEYDLLEISQSPNQWLAHFTSPANRHVLPLLTSLLNVICTYDPVGYGVP